MAEKRLPTQKDVRKATPIGRAPYIAAQKAVDHAIRIAASEHLSRNEETPKIRVAFGELYKGMLAKTLDPPIDTEGALGGLITDFNAVYNQHDVHRQVGIADSAAAIDALYLVIDHGNHPAQAMDVLISDDLRPLKSGAV